LTPIATAFKMWPSQAVVDSLIYWESPAHSAIMFGSVMVLFLSIKYVSLLSVCGNLALALLTATMAFRIYKSVLAAVNKGGEGHPFRAYLDMEVTMPEDKARDASSAFLRRFNAAVLKLRSLILIEDFVESLKFAAAMYLLTYVGRWMNGLTLLMLFWVVAFTAPRIYRDNQKQIDDALAPLKAKLSEVMDKAKTSVGGSAAAVAKKEE